MSRVSKPTAKFGISRVASCCVAALITFFIYSLGRPVFAQQPPGEDVGAQGERFRQDMQLRQEELEREPVKPAPIEIEEPKVEPAPVTPSFVLNSIEVTGSTLFSREDFLFAYESHLGKEISFKELEEIAVRIKGLYKEKGYLTTTAIVPEQEIKDGRVRIHVIEGKMGDLNINGKKWFSSERIKKYFHLKKNEILNIKILQRDLLRLNRNPDLDVQSVLSAGLAPETTDISIKVAESFPYHAGAGIDNQGTRLVGRYRPSFSLRSSNLSGRLDTVYLSYLFSARSSGESISYVLPLGTYGTKFLLNAAYFETKLGKEYLSSDITGATQIYSPGLNWELVLTEAIQAYAEVGIEIKAIKKKTGETVTANDQLRLPYVSLSIDSSDAFGRGGHTSWRPRLSFGTSSFLGASSRNHPTASRANTAGSFAKYEQDLSRIQRMPLGTYVFFKTHLQLASHTLPSSEQLGIGGLNSVRGFPEGEYLADSGGYANFEWYFPLKRQIEPFLFADLGKGVLKKVDSGTDKERFLASLGGGVKVRLKNNFFLSLAWANRVSDRPSPDSGPTSFHITFQSDI